MAVIIRMLLVKTVGKAILSALLLFCLTPMQSQYTNKQSHHQWRLLVEKIK